MKPAIDIKTIYMKCQFWLIGTFPRSRHRCVCAIPSLVRSGSLICCRIHKDNSGLTSKLFFMFFAHNCQHIHHTHVRHGTVDMMPKPSGARSFCVYTRHVPVHSDGGECLRLVTGILSCPLTEPWLIPIFVPGIGNVHCVHAWWCIYRADYKPVSRVYCHTKRVTIDLLG